MPSPLAEPYPPRFARWILLAAFAALAVSFGMRRRPAPPRPAVAVVAIDGGAAASSVSPHPGFIEVREVWWRPGDDHIRPQDCDELHAAWGAPDLAAFEAAMRAAGLSPEVISRVVGVTNCDPEGCVAVPPDEVLANLSEAQRVGVYRAMRGFPQAMLLNAPFSRPVGRTAFADAAGLSASAREVLRAGSFVVDDRRMFSDLTWLCHRVTDTAERAAFFRVLRARSSLDAVVRIRTERELERAVRWWGVQGREATVRARLTEGYLNSSDVPLRDLLPEFARQRFGTFPARDTRYDCFWTALNFFAPNGAGGELVDDLGFSSRTRGWAQIPLNELRFGDVLVFRAPAGDALHAAVYLAEDLVFTKDGWTMHRAWEVMRISQERRIYPNVDQLVAYRPPEGPQ